MHESFIVRLVGRVDLEFVHYDVFLHVGHRGMR